MTYKGTAAITPDPDVTKVTSLQLLALRADRLIIIPLLALSLHTPVMRAADIPQTLEQLWAAFAEMD